MSTSQTILKETDEHPKVVMDNDFISIKGVCMPENAVDMFKPVFEVIEDIKNSAQKLNIEVKLRYINSMSSKQLLRMFYDLNNSSVELNVQWKHSSEDELMKMKGEEIKSVLDLQNFDILVD